MSVAAALDIHWVQHRQVYCGSYCNAEGSLQTIGQTATALSTLSVAIYTFYAVYTNRPLRYRPWRCFIVVMAIWLWVLLWPMILLTRHDDPGVDEKGNVLYAYTPTPWCKYTFWRACMFDGN